MVDCKWERKGLGVRDWGLEERPGNHVALGDKLALASGLMEITYDTGAKVILQGPVTYEVESNGGYLAVGKLTGKFEKKAEGGRRKAEGAGNQKCPLPPPPFPLRCADSHRHGSRSWHRVFGGSETGSGDRGIRCPWYGRGRARR